MPNVTFQGAQPQGSNACGAYAVTAALHAFDNGFQPNGYNLAVQPAYLGSRLFALAVPNQPGPQVAPPQAGAASPFANQLYGVTGVLPGSGQAVNSEPATVASPPQQPQTRLQNTGLNSPYAMVSALLQLDPTLRACIRVTANCEAFLERLMGSQVVEGEIASLCALERASVERHAQVYAPPSLLEQNDRIAGAVQMVLVGNAQAPADAMHWPVRGANDAWYDPGDGSVANDWQVPQNVDPVLPQAGQSFGLATLAGSDYVWTGLWIDVLKLA